MYVCFLNFSSTDSRTVNVRAYRYSKHNLTLGLIKYRVLVPIPTYNRIKIHFRSQSEVTTSTTTLQANDDLKWVLSKNFNNYIFNVA